MFIELREKQTDRPADIDVREKHEMVASSMCPDLGLNLQPTEPPGQG